MATLTDVATKRVDTNTLTGGFRLRARPEEVEQWKLAAAEEGVSVAEWIRRCAAERIERGPRKERGALASTVVLADAVAAHTRQIKSMPQSKAEKCPRGYTHRPGSFCKHCDYGVEK